MTRNAFALARVADDLGLVSSGPRRALYAAVFLLPLLAALALAAAVAGWHRAVGFISVAVGALASTAIIVVLQSVGKTGSGLVVTGAGAVAALGCGARTVRPGATR